MSFRGLEKLFHLLGWPGLIFMFQLRLHPQHLRLENPWLVFRRSDLIILSMTQTAFVLDHEEYVGGHRGIHSKDGVSGLMDDDGGWWMMDA